MIQQQLMEIVKRRAPDMLEGEMRTRLNDAQKAYCDETHILLGQWRFTTQSGRMYYPIDDRCVAIRQADYNAELMDEFVGGMHNIPLQED